MTKTLQKLLTTCCLLLSCAACFAQQEDEIMDMKDPITGKWGYASKIQNRKSPVKGIKKFAVNTLGKMGSSLLTKSDADAIDWVIPPLYDAVATNFSEQVSGVEIDGRVGFIDINNRFIIEPQFEPVKELTGFSLGLAAVKRGDKYGYINKKGEMIIAAQFDYAENFKDNMLAVVKMNGKFGAIDLKGDIVVPCNYPVKATMITVPISNKLYRHARDSVKEAFDNHAYDKVWNKLKSCEREAQQRISDSLWIQPLITMPISDGTFHGIKDNYNRMIIPCRFSNIKYDEANHLYIVSDSLNRHGLYTYKGDRLFNPLFDSIGEFENGETTASVDSITGTIDANGHVAPAFMDEICNTGLRLDTEGNTAKARMLYERILTIDPNHVMSLNNLAIMDINNKDYAQGMRKLKLAHKLAPDNELISQNLHAAKKNRNERRWNRVTSGLEIAATIITLGAATYSAVKGVDVPASGLSTLGASTTTYDSSESAGLSSSSKTSSGGTSSKTKANHANWRSLDRSYSGYEDQLIKMKSSGNYNASEVRSIQRKMKEIRQKIYEQSGGHQRAVSPMESWNP